jgi:hypothetical protein
VKTFMLVQRVPPEPSNTNLRQYHGRVRHWHRARWIVVGEQQRLTLIA